VSLHGETFELGIFPMVLGNISVPLFIQVEYADRIALNLIILLSPV
jgi:hypothetical protein